MQPTAGQKALTIIRGILVVSILKTSTLHHITSSSLHLLCAKIKLTQVPFNSSLQASTGLARLMQYRAEGHLGAPKQPG